MTEDLARLMQLMGVSDGFRDTSEVWRETSPETARALLTAMDLEVATERELTETLARIEAERADRLLPDWQVVTADVTSEVPVARPLVARLTTEGGDVTDLWGPDSIALPPLPIGLHRLWAEGQSCTILSAPDRLPAPPRGWGVTLPLYGLRSAERGGLATYADLAMAAEALAEHGAGFIGINPVHAGFPTEPANVSPYAPSHRRRLNVAHLALAREPAGTKGPLVDQATDLPRRIEALRRAFRSMSAPPAEFVTFREAGGADLERFARHQALSDRFGPRWTDWPAAYHDPDGPAVALFAAEHAEDVTFHIWLQWQAERQLAAAASTARAAGMRWGLYLDLAVGTDPEGAEVWAEPDLYAPGVSLGAPPDDFSPAGQSWGLAPLDPHAMVRDGFRQFAETLRAQLRHARLLRIDHILGVERAFWVPRDGTAGGYVAMPREALLAVIRIEAARARATVIGEDLGNVPEGLRAALDDSGLLGCRVAMFERGWDGKPRPAQDYPQAVLASFGTHDLPTWVGWRQGRDIAARAELGIVTPEEAAEAQSHRAAEVAAFDTVAGTGEGEVAALHRFLAQSSAALVAVQIEDLLDLPDQPNLPGTIDDYPNWRQRLPVGANRLAAEPALRDIGALMTSADRRGPDMKRITVQTKPIEGQKPGTSGLRKKTKTFMEPHFLENFIQAIFDGIGGAEGKTFVLGGDGRYFNDRAAQVILRMAAANGAAKVIVGTNALLSTPAASNLIRQRGTDGGIIMSASHNPGGPEEDFGVKFNTPNGGPAPEEVTGRIFEATKTLSAYHILETQDADLSTPGLSDMGAMEIEVVDPVADYAALMEQLFDFDAIKGLLAGGFTLRFDAMHAVTGPYATAILQDRLGAAPGSVVNAVPSPDFGGGHPDPNPIWAKALMETMFAPDAPDFGAASDGDGDRNMIVGKGIYVTPSDSLAVLAANAHLAPGYAAGLKGVARSMPTSCALDAVAAARGMDCYETPTGWKFFGNLLDAGRATLCGEESAGTGSDHVREKDGLWAVLLWLNILAMSGKSVKQTLLDHWAEYGRNWYSRHDYEGVDAAAAERLMQGLRDKLAELPGTEVAGRRVEAADEFAYDDPVDGSHSGGQGIRVMLAGGGRMVFRLSGTGTVGATIRVYLEDRTDGSGDMDQDPQEALAGIIAAADELAGISERTGRTAPDVRT